MKKFIVLVGGVLLAMAILCGVHSFEVTRIEAQIAVYEEVNAQILEELSAPLCDWTVAIDENGEMIEYPPYDGGGIVSISKHPIAQNPMIQKEIEIYLDNEIKIAELKAQIAR